MDTALMPMITTIIPTYRRPQRLKQAIRSVLQQSYSNLLVCVYDNASGDNTAAIVAEMRELDQRVHYFCNETNIGPFANFQNALMRIETPFFSILSDDDLVLPEFMETALAGFEIHPNAMCSITDVIRVGANGSILNTALESWRSGLFVPPNGLMQIVEHGHSEWTGILFRSEVKEIVGLLDENTGRYSDLDYTLRMAARCPYVVSKHSCAIFDLSMSQIRAPYLFDDMWPGMLNMIRNLTDDSNIPIEVRHYVERVLLNKFNGGLFEAGLSYLSRGYPIDAGNVAALIRDRFGGWGRYIVLSTIIKLHSTIPVARMCYTAIIACRRYFRSRLVQCNQKRYHQLGRLVAKMHVED